MPVVFLLELGAFAHWSLAALPVLASAYGFAQVDAKTEDDFFLGWPSYWNVVALYVWLLELSPAVASAWVALFAALTFVPLKYIYPSKMRRLRAATAAAASLWVIAMALIARRPPSAARDLAAWLSLAYPAWYVVLSAWLGRGGVQVSRSEPKASEDHQDGRVSPPRGALLINLGTPDAPRPREVRRYLREFLSDPRVIDLPTLPRKLLLEAVILPTRPRRTAAAYAQGVERGRIAAARARRGAARERSSARLGAGWAVALGMRYGRPSIDDRAAPARGARRARGDRAAALPAVFVGRDRIRARRAVRGARRGAPAPDPRARPVLRRPGLHRARGATSPRPRSRASAPITCCSRITACPSGRSGPPTRSGAHCLAQRRLLCAAARGPSRPATARSAIATTAALVAALRLDPARTSTSFQSRLGRTPWIRPFTDHVLPELAAAAVRRLAILCPSFAADCLETVEEIGIRAREQWRSLGGEELLLVDCPNAHPTWVEAVAQLFLQTIRHRGERARRRGDARSQRVRHGDARDVGSREREPGQLALPLGEPAHARAVVAAGLRHGARPAHEAERRGRIGDPERARQILGETRG